ncbi:1710_t:CDS:2, partial [Gigaspora rosea]
GDMKIILANQKDFTLQDQTNINSLNIYNNPSTEWSADFTQVYEDQTNNSLPTEWSMELAQDQTTTNLPIIIQLPAGTIQNNEDQTNLSIERTTCFAQDQTNTNLFNIYNAGLTQHYEEQINNLQQQYNAKSVIEDKLPVSFVSSRKKKERTREMQEIGNKLIDDFIELTQFSFASFARKSNLEFIPYEQFTNIEYLAKGGFSIINRATWVNGPITRWCYKKQRYIRKGNHNVVLKILNDSEKMDSDFLNEVISGCRPFSNRKHDEYLILDILDGIRPKIPTNIPKELVELMERCWHQDPEKRKFSHYYDESEKRINYLQTELWTLYEKARDEKIKFTDNKGTNISPTEINDQAFYSSRPLTPLISKAMNLQSMRLNSNVITVRAKEFEKQDLVFMTYTGHAIAIINAVNVSHLIVQGASVEISG